MAGSRILIVEDEDIVAMELERSLQRLGYEVVARSGLGEEAIEKAKAHRPDLVLMDLGRTGEMSGIEAAETIWRQLAIPVVFLAGDADETTLQRALLAEPYGFLLTPLDSRELRSVIAIALRRHAAVETAQAQAREALRQTEAHLAERRQAEGAIREKELLLYFTLDRGAGS